MSYWVSVRVIGTFLFLIMAFFFVLTWDPILKVVDLGAQLAHLSAWMSYWVLRGLTRVHLEFTPAGAAR